jgi:CDP-paratose 2-epimerase
MSIALITGSAGLIGSEASRFFAGKDLDVIGIDNDMRQQFFDAEASTDWQRRLLEVELVKHYRHIIVDI